MDVGAFRDTEEGGRGASGNKSTQSIFLEIEVKGIRKASLKLKANQRANYETKYVSSWKTILFDQTTVIRS